MHEVALELKTLGIRAEILINSIPFDVFDSMATHFGMRSLNQYLVTGTNTITFRCSHASAANLFDSLPNKISINGSILHGKTGTAGGKVAEFKLGIEDCKPSLSGKQLICEAQFDYQGFDLTPWLKKLDSIKQSDHQKIENLIRHFFQLINSKNLNQLMEYVAVRQIIIGAAYGTSQRQEMQSLYQIWKEDLLTPGLYKKQFAPHELQLKPFLDGQCIQLMFDCDWNLKFNEHMTPKGINNFPVFTAAPISNSHYVFPTNIAKYEGNFILFI